MNVPSLGLCASERGSLTIQSPRLLPVDWKVEHERAASAGPREALRRDLPPTTAVFILVEHRRHAVVGDDEDVRRALHRGVGSRGVSVTKDVNWKRRAAAEVAREHGEYLLLIADEAIGRQHLVRSAPERCLYAGPGAQCRKAHDGAGERGIGCL